MLIYVDLLLLLNIWIDFLLLITTNIILKYRVSYKRIILGSLIGGISTFCILINNVFFLSLLKIIICLIMQLVVNGYKGIKTLFENVFYFYLTSIILAGFIYLFDDINMTLLENYILLFLITPIVLFLYRKSNKKLNIFYKDRYDVILIYKNKKYNFNAYLDTGNKLYDQYRRRPIVLIYTKKIKFNYKEGILVPIETANNTSLLRCIKIDKLIINDKEIKNVLIGLSDKSFNIDNINMILHKDIIGG